MNERNSRIDFPESYMREGTGEICLMEALNQIIEFLDTGGPILKVIAVTSFVLWVAIFERFLFLLVFKRQVSAPLIENWAKRIDKSSWTAKRIREGIIFDFSVQMKKSTGLIKSLIAICPLLGLMGTVTGMINVFEVMNTVGNSNPRLMASGISLATIPTMAGMVVALSGVFLGYLIESKAKSELNDFSRKLPIT